MLDGFAAPPEGRVEVLGLVCPHAGYVYSGRVAAETVAKSKPASTYVILGPNHTGAGQPFSLMREGVFRTPLGDARIDCDLAKEILKHSRLLEDDFLAHQREHSIEVQLPILQHFCGDFQFVPITVGHVSSGEELLKVCEDIGGAIASAVGARKDNVVVVASTDLTHYEPEDLAREKDDLAIKEILSLDAGGLINVVHENSISMCGVAPTAATIIACKKLGAAGAELVDYTTSAEASGDTSQVVGYAGVHVK